MASLPHKIKNRKITLLTNLNFKTMTRQKKIYLEESEMPKQWYNLTPDLPTPLNPPLGPDGNP
jgi:hypothetical protein